MDFVFVGADQRQEEAGWKLLAPAAGVQDNGRAGRFCLLLRLVGAIALQVHGGGDFTKQFVRYRKIRVKELD